MPDIATIFVIGNTAALASWLLLAAFPRWHGTQLWCGAVFPFLIGLAYIALILTATGVDEAGSFESIEGVRALFANDTVLTAAWFHFLAFDLFVGAWIVREGNRLGMQRLLVLPCLPLTFLFGPAGLVLFFVVRAVSLRLRHRQA